MVDVLMPYAESPASESRPAAPRLASLAGARVGIVNNSWRCMDVITAELASRLTSDFGVSAVLEERISAAQTLPDDAFPAMADRCDAVVVGIGN